MISSSIIDVVPSHNPNTPFCFLTILTLLGLGVVIFFVDLGESRREQQWYLIEEEKEAVVEVVEVEEGRR